MTDVPSFDNHRLNSFEEHLRQVQADVTGLRRSHQDLQRSVDGLRSEMNQRFDTLESRLETVIEEMRRFFDRYVQVDAER